MKGEFNLETSLGYLLGRTQASMKMSFNRAIKEAGIDATAEQWGLLNIIKAAPGIIQSDLAERSIKDKTNVTRMLDVLEKNGCIERARDTRDRRAYRVFITGKGTALLRRLVPLAVRTNEEAARGLGAKEIKALTDILAILYHNTKGG
ncbi:MAG: MarR family transcriptional regulator [Spirochaetes bacterium]|nr:MAG: MarR family transcriptional regulator [Spirochaetota bacterium]